MVLLYLLGCWTSIQFNFCPFWLFFVFKLLSFFWLCEEAQCVYLCLHLGWKSNFILISSRYCLLNGCMEAAEFRRWYHPNFCSLPCTHYPFLFPHSIHHQLQRRCGPLSNLVETLKQETLSCVVRPSRFKLLGLNCPIFAENTGLLIEHL